MRKFFLLLFLVSLFAAAVAESTSTSASVSCPAIPEEAEPIPA